MFDGNPAPSVTPGPEGSSSIRSALAAGFFAEFAASLDRSIPGVHFGHIPVQPRALDPGMGVAVARRTVFREGDNECFGRVADRVAAGNMALLGHPLTDDEQLEKARLRNAIATGALLTSGRHLQHGDETQPQRNLEVYSNCATAIASFAKFYLLLNGAGVGRAYDDALVMVNWHAAPQVLLYLSPDHPDYPHTEAARVRLGIELEVLPTDTVSDPDGVMPRYLAENLVADLSTIPGDAMYHRIGDSREGWAKALEILEAMAFRGEREKTLVFDYSDIRAAGSPIAGMQNRPASGPVSLMRAFLNLRNHVVNNSIAMPLWKQALYVDHFYSVEVQVGGARRAARMATKNWRDAGILEFIRIKTEGGLWTANHSIMVDQEFWRFVQDDPSVDYTDPHERALSKHARAVFEEATRCCYINGEPGFINGHLLEDHRTGIAWDKPVYDDGRDFHSSRYQVTEAMGLLADAAHRASLSDFPATVNPCAELVLHVTGGVCVIADFAPLLACPVPLESVTPGAVSDDIATLWDARVEDAVRLGVRLIVRVNMMDALYGEEIARTNRVGIGPTGLHDYAWLRFGLDFNDLLDRRISKPFWDQMDRFSAAAKDEGCLYSRQLGRNRPATVTTIKPAGTTSKLFGLTEGVHLPARRQYLRWVQFKGIQDAETGTWNIGSDPLLADYAARGYPLRTLKTFPGMTIVGFPTVPLLMRLNIGYRCVTASEASPEDQYQWLRLLEQHWIGAEQGNQISYTLKVFTDKYDLEDFRDIVQQNQPTVRCCAILPTRPDDELGFEYLPEEEVSLDRFAMIVAGIEDDAVIEGIDLVHLQCANGACPII